VRLLKNTTSLLESIADVLPAALLAADLLPAEYTAGRANLTGKCQNDFWSTVVLPPLP